MISSLKKKRKERGLIPGCHWLWRKLNLLQFLSWQFAQVKKIKHFTKWTKVVMIFRHGEGGRKGVNKTIIWCCYRLSKNLNMIISGSSYCCSVYLIENLQIYVQFLHICNQKKKKNEMQLNYGSRNDQLTWYFLRRRCFKIYIYIYNACSWPAVRNHMSANIVKL